MCHEFGLNTLQDTYKYIRRLNVGRSDFDWSGMLDQKITCSHFWCQRPSIRIFEIIS